MTFSTWFLHSFDRDNGWRAQEGLSGTRRRSKHGTHGNTSSAHPTSWEGSAHFGFIKPHHGVFPGSVYKMGPTVCVVLNCSWHQLLWLLAKPLSPTALWIPWGGVCSHSLAHPFIPQTTVAWVLWARYCTKRHQHSFPKAQHHTVAHHSSASGLLHQCSLWRALLPIIPRLASSLYSPFKCYACRETFPKCFIGNSAFKQDSTLPYPCSASDCAYVYQYHTY